MYVLAGTRRPSSLGQAGSVAAALVTGIASVVMTSIQLIYQEIQANKARAQWRHDQRRLQEEARVRAAELERKNKELEDYITTITNPASTDGGLESYVPAGYAPYIPYILVGGGVAALWMLSRRAAA